MPDVLATRLQNFAANAIAAGLQIALILVLALVAYLALQVIAERLRQLLAEQVDGLPEERDQYALTVSSVVRNTGRVAIVSVGGSMILEEVGVPIAPVLAGAGIVGLAIGFGAQTLVKDVISGLFILVERQFGVGDVIKVDGIAGSVEKMTLRATFLRDAEGTSHVIPNGEIRILSNLTKGWAQAILDVGISYADSIDHATRVLESIGEEMAADSKFGKLLLDKPVVLGVQELGDSAVVLRLTARTHPGKQFDVTRELRRRVKERFEAEGIELPYPTQARITRVIYEGGAPARLENELES